MTRAISHAVSDHRSDERCHETWRRAIRGDMSRTKTTTDDGDEVRPIGLAAITIA